MLYKLNGDNISTIQLEKKDDDLMYSFPNQTQISYCSIELDTRFFINNNIIISLIGDNENISTVVFPPVGKSKSCEYQCPIFADNTTKLQAIEIKTSNSWFTSISSGKMNFVEKLSN